MTWHHRKYTTIERRGAVAIVRFDRHGSMNALNREAIFELTDLARSFHNDLSCRAIVLTGTSKVFSAGADLKDGEVPEDFAQYRQNSKIGRYLCSAWESCPQIVVAAMEGPIIGGAAALAILCDWRVMGESAFLYVPEIKLGVPLQWQAMPRLLNLVNPARAKRIAILCERMSADQALDWGIADEVTADGNTIEVAFALAEKAAAMPAEVTALTKETINATANALNHVASHLDSEAWMLHRQSAPAVKAREEFRSRKK